MKLLHSGKVRDVYDLGQHVLLVATDRVSAFDVVLPTPIPHKGAVLTQMSAFWFGQTADLIPNHLVAADVAAKPASVDPLPIALPWNVNEIAGIGIPATAPVTVASSCVLVPRATCLPSAITLCAASCTVVVIFSCALST